MGTCELCDAVQFVSGALSYSHLGSLHCDCQGEWGHVSSVMLYNLYQEHCHIHTLGLYIVTVKVSGDV